MSRDTEPFPLGGDGDDETVRRLRRALEGEAMTVEPSDDGLGRIQEQTEGGGPRRWLPWVAGLAAAAVVVGVVGVTLLGGDDAPPVASPTETVEPTDGVVVQPTEPAEPTTAPPTDVLTDGPVETDAPGGELTGVPVYWVGETRASFRLFREFRDVPDTGGPVSSAIQTVLAGRPLDPDYSSPWAPASEVSVTVEGDEVLVDLSADAFAEGVGSELAALGIQQLVYTATAAAQVPGPVTITVDGEPADAWGVISLGEPIERAPMGEVQNPTWILSPGQDEVLDAGRVEVTGYGTAFEGNFLWEVRDGGGSVVAEGFATGGSMGEFGEFSFTTELTEGRYTVEVWQPDESDGESPEGPRMFPDSKDITVR